MATWSVYFVQVMEDAGITSSGTLDFVTKVMPLFVYPVILFAIVLLFSLGVIPGFGNIKTAMQKVKDGTYDFSVYGIEDDTFETESKAKPIDFIVPLVILLGFGIYYNGDLAVACLIVIFIELIWFLARRIMTFSEFIDINHRSDFNPRAPRGARLLMQGKTQAAIAFQSTCPARGTTFA